MALSRNRSHIFRILLLLLLHTGGRTLFAQSGSGETPAFPDSSMHAEPQQSPTSTGGTSTPVWTDDKWKRAIDGIEYKKDPEEEEEEEKTTSDETSSESDSDSFELGEWLKSILTSSTGKIICISLIIVLLILFILRLVGARAKGLGKKVTLVEEISMNEIEERFQEADLEQYLQMAQSSGDYKKAVRLHYLILIKLLNELKKISWKKEKTNQDYLNEMRTSDNYKQFRDLTLVYEVVWYGNRSISAEEFSALAAAFSAYKKTLPVHSNAN